MSYCGTDETLTGWMNENLAVSGWMIALRLVNV